jgi:hypothetical protein
MFTDEGEPMIDDLYNEQHILAQVAFYESEFNRLSKSLADDDPKLEQIRCQWKDWRKNLDWCRCYFRKHSS